MQESLSLLSAIAARTSRIRIGTAILLLAMRNPVIVAKSLATIERLSGGRLTVGVGIGGEFPPEWSAVGVSRKTRAARTEEMIDALRGLWGPGTFSMSGRHVKITDVDLHPKPSLRPSIWIGGRSEGALRRAARLGDGWMGLFMTPERYAESLAQVRSHAAAFDRDPEGIVPSLYIWTALADTNEEARERASALMSAFYNLPFEKLERYAIAGDAATCIARFKEFADAGVEHFAVAPLLAGIDLEFVDRLSAISGAV